MNPVSIGCVRPAWFAGTSMVCAWPPGRMSRSKTVTSWCAERKWRQPSPPIPDPMMAIRSRTWHRGFSLRPLGFFVDGIRDALQAPDQPHPSQHLEAVVGRVKFPPVEALLRRRLIPVVIIVPAFAERDEREDQGVPGLITGGLEALGAPDVCERVDASDRAGAAGPPEPPQPVQGRGPRGCGRWRHRAHRLRHRDGRRWLLAQQPGLQARGQRHGRCRGGARGLHRRRHCPSRRSR